MNRIKNLIVKKGVSIYEAASSTGIPYSTMHDYCEGRMNPSTVNAIKLARYFGITVEDLFAANK